MDIGGRTAATFATGVISGVRRARPGRAGARHRRASTTRRSGDLGPVFVLLFGSAAIGDAVLRARSCCAIARRQRDLARARVRWPRVREPSILIVHPDRKTQRTVQRILGVDRLSRRHRRRPRAGHPAARSTSRRCSSSSTARRAVAARRRVLRGRAGARRRGVHDAARRRRGRRRCRRSSASARSRTCSSTRCRCSPRS